MLCSLGIHRWRDCKKALWHLEHVTASLELSACTRCGKIRREDEIQLRYLEAIAPCATVIERIADHA